MNHQITKKVIATLTSVATVAMMTAGAFVPLALGVDIPPTTNTMTLEQWWEYFGGGAPLTPGATAASAITRTLASLSGTDLPVLSSVNVGSPTFSVNSVAVKGNYAYVAKAQGQPLPPPPNAVNWVVGDPMPTVGALEVWNITNPSAPTLIGQVTGCNYYTESSQACQINSMTVVGNYLFALNGGGLNTAGFSIFQPGGIIVYDISNPASPVQLESKFPNPGVSPFPVNDQVMSAGISMDVRLESDGKYYIATTATIQFRAHLWTFDPVGAPGSRLAHRSEVFFGMTPRAITFVPGTPNALVNTLSFPNTIVYPLQITTGATPAMSYAAGSTVLPFISSFGLKSVGAKTYITVPGSTTVPAQFKVLDTTNPLVPAALGSANIPNSLNPRAIGSVQIEASGNIAFVTAGRNNPNLVPVPPNGAVYAFDTSNPSAPVLAADSVEGQWVQAGFKNALDPTYKRMVISDNGLFYFLSPTRVPSGKMAIVDVSPVLPSDTDGDGVTDDIDDCDTIVGPAERNGCPFADVLTFAMQKIGSGPATVSPVQGVQLKVFNKDNPAFIAAYPGPLHNQFSAIWNGSVGQVGSCTTDGDGLCVAGEAAAGNYLVVGKFVDAEDPFSTVYVGKSKSTADFVDGVATLDLKLIKKFKKGGVFDEYLPNGQVQVAGAPASSNTGSLLALAAAALAAGLGIGVYARRRA